MRRKETTEELVKNDVNLRHGMLESRPRAYIVTFRFISLKQLVIWQYT